MLSAGVDATGCCARSIGFADLGLTTLSGGEVELGVPTYNEICGQRACGVWVLKAQVVRHGVSPGGWLVMPA